MTRPPLTPVWTDPDFAELLAEDPELVAIADAVQQTCTVRPARRGPRAAAFGAVAAASVAVAAIVGLVLLAPWSRDSQAAVLERIGSALTPKPGWVLYERDVVRQVEVNGGLPVTSVSESWTRFAPPYSFRSVIRTPRSPPPEEGDAFQSGRAFVFDPATNSLYRDDPLIVRTKRPPRTRQERGPPPLDLGHQDHRLPLPAADYPQPAVREHPRASPRCRSRGGPRDA